MQLALGVGDRRLGHGDGRVRERPLGGVPARARAERDRLHQRVAAEAVRAVHRHAARLAGGVQALELGLAPHVGVDAAHVVVGARPDGDRLVDRVDAGEGHRQLARPGQPLDDLLRAEVAQVEETSRSTPRPSSISVCSARETTSREASSIAFGAYLAMKRSPSRLIR